MSRSNSRSPTPERYPSRNRTPVIRTGTLSELGITAPEEKTVWNWAMRRRCAARPIAILPRTASKRIGTELDDRIAEIDAASAASWRAAKKTAFHNKRKAHDKDVALMSRIFAAMPDPMAAIPAPAPAPVSGSCSSGAAYIAHDVKIAPPAPIIGQWTQRIAKYPQNKPADYDEDVVVVKVKRARKDPEE